MTSTMIMMANVYPHTEKEDEEIMKDEDMEEEDEE